MAKIEQTVDIAAPAAEAYREWTRFEAFGIFMHGVVRVIREDDVTHHWTTKVGGVRREFETKITEELPGKRMAWETVEGVPHQGAVEFLELDPGRTRMTVRIDWHPGSMLEKAGATLGSDHREVRNELWRFKQYVETGGSETHHPASEHGLGSRDYYGGTAGGGFPPGYTEQHDIPVQDPAAGKDQPAGGSPETGESTEAESSGR